MNRPPLSALFAALALLGAGCFNRAPLISPSIAEPIGKNLEERPITQTQGFGRLPKTPPPQLRPGVRGSIRILAESPSLPPTISVLRVKNGRPNDTQLRNILNSFDIPGAVLGENPDGGKVALEWKDAEGTQWRALTAERTLKFLTTQPTFTNLSVSKLPDKQAAIDKAASFLQSHGASLKRYGTSYVAPDWKAWLEDEQAQGRCMNAQSLLTIRSLGDPLAAPEKPPLTLPPQRDATCLNPEFPPHLVVRFNAMQDGQAILHGDGSSRYGAIIVVNAATEEVMSGWFTLPVDPERSDYPTLTPDEVRDRLARGGQGGTPNGEVTITAATFEWYAMNDGREPKTEYLYPAIVGHGAIKYPNGTTSPYTIVVPVIKDQ